MRIESILNGDISLFDSVYGKLTVHVCSVALLLVSIATMAPIVVAKTPSAGLLINGGEHIILQGRLTSPYGMVASPFGRGELRDHKGIDIAAPIGTPVFAPNDGVIISASDNYQGKPKYGKVVVLQSSDKVRTLFAHLDSYSVTSGQRVKAGQHIATVGNTGASSGPHVHIERFEKDQRVDPLQVWQLAQ